MNYRGLLLTLLVSMMLLLAACGGAPNGAAPAGNDAAVVDETTTTDAAGDSDAEEAPTAESPPEEEAAAEEAGDDAADATGDGLRLFTVVPGESKAMYLVDEEFFSGALDKLGIAAGEYDIVGTTDQIEGELSLDLAGTAIGPSEFRVNLTSLSTDQNRRDNWIRENGPRFNQFPQATFVATGIEEAPEAYTEGEEVTFRLVGDMTIREVTQPMTFDVTATLAGDTITGTATSTALLTDFEIEPPNFANTLTVADEFQIQVDFVAREQ